MSSAPASKPLHPIIVKIYKAIDAIQIYFVEIALFFFFLNRHMSLPLFQEYVESEIYSQHGVPFAGFDDLKNKSLSDPERDEAHHESVLVVLGLQIAEGLPSIVTVIILGAVSDKTGRHRILLWLPALGCCVHSLIYILILYTQWNIDGLFLAAAFRGLSGSMTGFLAGSSYYAINYVKPEQRLNRLAMQEFLNGGAYAIGNIMVGFWVKDGGFLKPFWFTLICGLIAVLISFFLVKETKSDQENQSSSPLLRRQSADNCCKDTFGPLVKYLKCIGNSTLTKIWLAIVVFQAYAFVHIGQINTMVLYLSQQHFLFGSENPVTGEGPLAKIGLFLAVIMAVAALATGLCTPIFQKFLSDNSIVFLGFASKALGTLWIAVIRNETLLYFAILLLAFELLPFPILRAKVAKHVRPSEQGTVFAMMHCGESITYFLAPFTFSGIYASTMSFYSGFVLIVSMLILILPVVFLFVLKFVERRCPEEYQQMEDEAAPVEPVVTPVLTSNTSQEAQQSQSMLPEEPISFIQLSSNGANIEV
ncbi:solute carrier family 46 member 3 [Aplysia californica]|uniref:Solute carrier family 46 member 3 n=1 Tax=Aplysia californica TaxID=6500 RepID=A0ABM0JCV5_APLCA|nr:solute carrier family 46 member 3 [Aplysia californica]